MKYRGLPIRRIILMGRASRPRPLRLAEKLLQVRTALGLSQNGMIRRLGFVEEITQDYISAYERGVREPPLPVLLQYARSANVLVEVLIDDELDLPEQLPPTARSEGVRRLSPSSKRTRKDKKN
jgi:transcriptional regulator with XRE-family HTH domain